MSRKPRNFHSGGIYHITHRGHNRLYIFENDLDKAIFLDSLRKILREANAHLLYYVLMDNHYHLLLEMNATPIHVIMQRLNTSYGRHFAHAYHTSGAVFGNRYAVEEISEADYFGNVIKYMALNPVRAGIVQNIGEYRWSAHLDLVQKKDRLVNSQRLFEILGRTPERGRTFYLEMIQHAQSQPGPLLRQKDFQAKRKQQRLESQLVTYLASQGGTVSPEQVQSEQKTAAIVQLRRDFARQAYNQGYTVNEIAVALKVSSRSVRKWCQSDPRHAGDDPIIPMEV